MKPASRPPGQSTSIKQEQAMSRRESLVLIAAATAAALANFEQAMA
jgi:hypothetical protein